MERGYCRDQRPCFSRVPGTRICNCLIGISYKDGECPFCKPEREVTNGRRYPYDPTFCERKIYGRRAEM